MAGNGWEWCADWYDKNFYRNSPGYNPQGPASGTGRVLRGGSWYFLFGDLVRVARRAGVNPGHRAQFNDGFRGSSPRVPR